MSRRTIKRNQLMYPWLYSDGYGPVPQFRQSYTEFVKRFNAGRDARPANERVAGYVVTDTGKAALEFTPCLAINRSEDTNPTTSLKAAKTE